MKKSNKIDFKKASDMMIERLEYVFNAKAIDVWRRNIGTIITFEMPNFCNTMDVCTEANLCIAIAKNRGLIYSGSISYENNNITVKLF